MVLPNRIDQEGRGFAIQKRIKYVQLAPQGAAKWPARTPDRASAWFWLDWTNRDQKAQEVGLLRCSMGRVSNGSAFLVHFK